MSNSVTITDNRNGKSYEFPIYDGTTGPSVVDMSSFYKQTGMFSYDEGLTSTATCKSKITYIDGENGILMHRGYPIEWLAENKLYLDVVHLLLYKELPDATRLEAFRYEMKNVLLSMKVCTVFLILSLIMLILWQFYKVLFHRLVLFILII